MPSKRLAIGGPFAYGLLQFLVTLGGRQERRLITGVEMSASNEEIARDIVVATINNRNIPLNGAELAALYAAVLAGVRQAVNTRA